MKNKDKVYILWFLFLVCFFQPMCVQASVIEPGLFDTEEGVLIVETESGDRLFEKEAKHRFYPASTTKLVTALVVCDEVKNLSEKIIVGDEINNLDPDSSVAHLEIGESLSYMDLLYGLMLPSGNDAAMVLAHHVGKKRDSLNPIAGFVALMNDKVKSLGLSDSHFVNPHGLHHSEHYTTPEDLAVIAEECLKSETLNKVMNTSLYTCKGLKGKEHRWYNSNLNLYADRIPEEYDRSGKYPGKNPFYHEMVRGGKTGFTDEAGRCFVFFSDIGEMKIVGVLLQAEDRVGIFVQSKALTEQVNRFYSLLDWNEVLHAESHRVINPRSRQDKFLNLQTDKETLSCLPEDQKQKYQLNYVWDETYCYEENGAIRLKQSITGNEKIGEAIVLLNNREIKRFPLISTHTVSKRSWVSILRDIFLKVQSVIVVNRWSDMKVLL